MVNTVVSTKVVTAPRISYPQNWPAYNAAQQREYGLFKKLLRDLCSEVPLTERKRGRPRVPLQQMVYAAAMKVYLGKSLRRSEDHLKVHNPNSEPRPLCSYVTISNIMKSPELTPILHSLIETSSLPLKEVETDFAIDSTGFSISSFGRYFDFKHGKNRRYHNWIKAHVVAGVKTNIVASVRLSEEHDHDAPFFMPLITDVAENFKIGDVSADKAYVSRMNYEIVAKLGGTPLIRFKENNHAGPPSAKAWNKMWHFYSLNKGEFLKRYHKRSNVESTFSAIKAKFGGSVKSKNPTAQKNEVLLKILCHNICVLIQEMHELNINVGSESDFVGNSNE